MPHIPGHGISFADWFKNNPQQIGNRTIPKWIQNQQPFVNPLQGRVTPPRVHDAPPQASNRTADFVTAMGQMAGYTPPTGGLGVSLGGQQVVGGNRLDQEGLADAMNRVRAAMSRPSFLDYLGGR